MANTFELIASSTVGSGGAASIDFTSIASTYTDLVLKVSTRSNTAAALTAVNLSLNSSTASFTAKFLLGTGSAAVSGSQARFTGHADAATATSNTFQNGEIYIPNYAGSNYKSYSADSVQEDNTTAAYASLIAGLWSNTAAITSVTLTPDAGSFVQYSTAYLYGVKNA
jgi:hypothetical protein